MERASVKYVKYSQYVRERIVEMRKEQKSLKKVKELLQSEGHDVSYEGVRRFWSRYTERGHIFDAKRDGGIDHFLQQHPLVKVHIHRMLTEDNELTAEQIKAKLQAEHGEIFFLLECAVLANFFETVYGLVFSLLAK